MEDGWIKWSGGACPLADGTAHEVKFRSGSTFWDDEPKTWTWAHEGYWHDIVAFRLSTSSKK